MKKRWTLLRPLSLATRTHLNKLKLSRVDAAGYRQDYKRWVCSGCEGPQPISPPTISYKEAQGIRAKVDGLYNPGKKT